MPQALDSDWKEPPLQRRRTGAAAAAALQPPTRGTNAKTTMTVKRILDIIKDNSGPLRAAPATGASVANRHDDVRDGSVAAGDQVQASSFGAPSYGLMFGSGNQLANAV
jgi:hypothetical protein